jgi:tetratricopeptide (TPR) repeat protein
MLWQPPAKSSILELAIAHLFEDGPAAFPAWASFRMKFFLTVAMLSAMAAPLCGQTRQTTADDYLQSASRPVARTQQERNDYLTATQAPTGAGLEAAADNFARQYPQSQLRVHLYAQAMQAYERENNGPRVLAMAEKVLALNPNHSVALVLTATALADELNSTDRDRDRKVDAIKRAANRAIHGIDSGFVPPPTASPEDVARYRATLQSMAYSALGIMRLKTGDDAGAEKDLATALSLDRLRPDASLWYHLALAQDHRRKYSSALNSVEQALQLSSTNPELQKLAEIEYDRLAGLAGRAPRPQSDSGAAIPH